MKIGVYSLQRVLYRGAAREVNCMTTTGEITILDHHEPLISTLTAGTMKIVDNAGEAHYIPVSSGFLEVREGSETRFLVSEGEKSG